MTASHDEHRPSVTDYEIIGTTLSADAEELPMRLRPVLRLRVAPDVYALLYDGDGEDETLVPEHRERVELMFAEERFYRFPVPIPARPGYWLIQVKAGAPPEYLAGADARQRIRDEGERALGESDRALASGALDLARARAAYASAALEEDPFPCLALVALWRGDITESQLDFALAPLHDFLADHIERRFREVWKANRYPELIERIRRDPLSYEYKLRPGWLRASSSALRHQTMSSLFSQHAEMNNAA
jgi:hypothetical protein